MDKLIICGPQSRHKKSITSYMIKIDSMRDYGNRFPSVELDLTQYS